MKRDCKRIIALILALLMMICMTACKDDSEEAASDSSTAAGVGQADIVIEENEHSRRAEIRITEEYL